MDQFNFILEQFGLQYLKPRLYKPGSSLKEGHTDMTGAKVLFPVELDTSMNTREYGAVQFSMLGTPIFCDMILRESEKSPGVHLEWVLVEVSQTKNIVKTAVMGRDGTVKEYIADGDYQVQIRGGLFSPFSQRYPKEQVQDLLAICKLKKSIEVVSEFAQLFSIHNLVIEESRFPQREGIQNIQLFDLKCVSDEPIQLKRRL